MSPEFAESIKNGWQVQTLAQCARQYLITKVHHMPSVGTLIHSTVDNSHQTTLKLFAMYTLSCFKMHKGNALTRCLHETLDFFIK